MAELEIEGSFEEQWGTIKSALKSLHVLCFGNGKQGMKADMTDLQMELADIKTSIRVSIFWARAIAGILTLFFLAATFYFVHLEARGSTSRIFFPPHVVQPHQTAPAMAFRGPVQPLH